MLQYQPRPLVVIRNQLLAFLVLNLLGSCMQINSVQPPSAAVDDGCSPGKPAVTALTSQIKLLSLNTNSR